MAKQPKDRKKNSKPLKEGKDLLQTIAAARAAGKIWTPNRYGAQNARAFLIAAIPIIAGGAESHNAAITATAKRGCILRIAGMPKRHDRAARKKPVKAGISSLGGVFAQPSLVRLKCAIG
jgi:hypothetical protein